MNQLNIIDIIVLISVFIVLICVFLRFLFGCAIITDLFSALVLFPFLSSPSQVPECRHAIIFNSSGSIIGYTTNYQATSTSFELFDESATRISSFTLTSSGAYLVTATIVMLVLLILVLLPI